MEEPKCVCYWGHCSFRDINFDVLRGVLSLGLEIRIASIDEAATVHKIMLEAFEEFKGKLNPPSGVFSESVDDVLKCMLQGGAIIALENHTPIGSSRYKLCNGYTYIERVSVLPTYQKRGIGKAMVRFIENLSLDLGIIESQIGVRLSIPNNVEFYKSMGYKVITIDHYPAKTDSWYTMSKRLNE